MPERKDSMPAATIKTTVRNYALIIIGTALMAFATASVLEPASLITGGFSGIAIIVNAENPVEDLGVEQIAGLFITGDSDPETAETLTALEQRGKTGKIGVEEIFRSIGFDGILNYYDIPDGVLNLDIEQAFCAHTGWNPRLAAPYVVNADPGLVERIGHDMIKGITISAPGFYGPQGRYVRALPADPRLNEKIMSFDWHGERITNYEMESSMLAGMAHLLGHRAMTVCAIIAGRVSHSMNTNYKGSVEELIETVLERL